MDLLHADGGYILNDKWPASHRPKFTVPFQVSRIYVVLWVTPIVSRQDPNVTEIVYHMHHKPSKRFGFCTACHAPIQATQNDSAPSNGKYGIKKTVYYENAMQPYLDHNELRLSLKPLRQLLMILKPKAPDTQYVLSVREPFA